MKTRSNFSYELKEFHNQKFISIIDFNDSGMSVTNDIENVVDSIAKNKGIDPSQYLIIYKDSTGQWDGWYHDQQTFVHLGHFNEFEAASEYVFRKIK